MALSEKDVRGIAEYAKIALTDDELAQSSSSVSAIFAYSAMPRTSFSLSAIGAPFRITDKPL